MSALGETINDAKATREEQIVADVLSRFHALTQAETKNSYVPSEENSRAIGTARLELVRWILDAATHRKDGAA